MAKIAFPECGKILNTHGCKGGVKAEPWCDSAKVLAGLSTVYFKKNGEFEPHTVKKASVFRELVLLELSGVENMETAELLKNHIIYAKREDLKLGEGVLLQAELIGLPVYDADSGEIYGNLREIIKPGVTDIYVVDTKNGEAMIPAVSAFVKKTDEERGIAVTPIEGMIP